MEKKTIKEISKLWSEDKRQYVKLSTISAYVLILENHILPDFGNETEFCESKVQKLVLQKLNSGLSRKSVRDILIVIKMVQKFGAKHGWLQYQEWSIKYPTEQTKHELEVLSVSHQRKIM